MNESLYNVAQGQTMHLNFKQCYKNKCLCFLRMLSVLLIKCIGNQTRPQQSVFWTNFWYAMKLSMCIKLSISTSLGRIHLFCACSATLPIYILHHDQFLAFAQYSFQDANLTKQT